MRTTRTAWTFLLLSALAGCNELDRKVDCRDICTRYKDCISNDYNVDRCEDRCNEKESDDELRQIDRCSDCIDDRSCTGSAFNCGEECTGVVP